MDNQFRNKSLWLVMIVLLGAVLACNLPMGEADNASTLQNSGEQTQGEQSSEGSDDTRVSPNGLSVEPDPLTVEMGLSRLSPYPINTEVVTPYWDYRVLEFHRGEDALQIIQAENPDSPPPPPGKEYVLVKVWLRNKNPAPNEQNFSIDDIFVTGDSLQVHGDVLIDIPAPEIVFSDIYTAEIFEGWIDVLVEPTEGNLILAFDRAEYIDSESTPREIRYVALDEGASIGVPAELDVIVPNDLGLALENPAKIDETVIGEDWEATILEAVHGDDALDIVMQMNDKNKHPEDGLEYIAFRARLRRISTTDRIEGYPIFSAYAPGQGQHSSDFLSIPRGVFNKNKEKFPWMEYNFFPGLENEGWFVLAAPAGQTPQIARLNVGGDFQTKDRYLLLTP